MQIVQIQIDNFKSFAEKTVIPFRGGFTTISGPNGSGKSNIIDSVLFCLGLSSSRVMRAEKLTDLINNLTKRREAIVRIGFADLPKDNAEQDIEPQFWIARRIKENPGGVTSTYYLNDRPCTLSDVHEHLAQYHISPGTYNVMMQGDVAGIVNMSATERRKILDEMAGIAEFDRKIDQAHTELTATTANIDRNTILLTELAERLVVLTTERETALKYQQLREQRQQLEQQLKAIEVKELADTLQRLKGNMAELDGRQAEQQTQMAQLQSQLAEAQTALNDVNLAIQRKGEDQYLAIRNQMEGLKGHIDRKQQTIKHLNDQLADHASQRQQMQQETARKTDLRDQLAEQCATLTSQIAELAGLWKTEHTAYQNLQKQLDGLLSDTQQVERQRLRGLLETASDELAAVKRQMLDQQAVLQRQQADAEAQQARYSEQREQLGQVTHKLTTAQTDLHTAVLDADAARAAVEKTQLQLTNSRVKLKSLTLDWDQLRQKVMQLTAQKKAYEDVQFGRSVDLILQSGLDGIHGTLAQLATVPDEYSLALEIALGGRMQHIVVDNERVAQQGIEYLKQRRGGRATSLPLNKISPARSLPAAPNRAGVIDFALNLLSYNRTYDDVFAFAAGDTLVVETLEFARPMMKQYRMVTQDGSLLEKTGAMTGGSSPQRSGAKFANTQGLDAQITEAEDQLTTLTAQRQQLDKQLQMLEAALLDHQRAAAMAEQQRVKLQAAVDALTEQQGTLQSSLGPVSMQPQTVGLSTDQLSQLTKQAEAKEADVTRLADALAVLDAQFPAEQMDTLRKEIADQAFQVEYYDTQKRNLESDLKARELEQQNHDQALAHYAERMATLTTKDAEYTRDIANCHEEIAVTQTQLTALEAQIALIDDELKGLQQQRVQAQQHLLELEKQKHGVERQMQQLADQRLGYQARIRELTPKWQQLKADLVAAFGDQPIPDDLPPRDETETRLKRTTDSMTRMEPVNMKAIQEYDEVNTRQTELNQRIDTLTTERDALMLRIAGYEDLKRVSFLQTFEQVDNHFKAIFAELSDGIGQLVLTDAENPLNGGLTIQAQPRGKKMQRLEAMSGGEKSLTSLAFVFSLQRVTPAPFYALDEVDQNLDGMNAERLAQLVQREAQHSQFIVVSLRKPMLGASHRTIGVTQKRDGITKVTGVLLRDALLAATEAQPAA
jgi:chromosome segregation protein